jgi:hypothetical protein
MADGAQTSVDLRIGLIEKMERLRVREWLVAKFEASGLSEEEFCRKLDTEQHFLASSRSKILCYAGQGPKAWMSCGLAVELAASANKKFEECTPLDLFRLAARAQKVAIQSSVAIPVLDQLPAEKSPVSVLFEYCQAKQIRPPQFRLTLVESEPQARWRCDLDVPWAEEPLLAEGPSQKAARIEASRAALVGARALQPEPI